MQLSTQKKLRLVPHSLVTLSLEEGRHCESIKFKKFFSAFGISHVSQGLVARLMALFEAGGILLQAQDQVVTFVDCDLFTQKHSQSQLECTKLIAQ